MQDGAQIFTSVNFDPSASRDLDLFGLTDQHLVSCQSARIHGEVLAPLTTLIDRAAQVGFDLQVASGFRSFDRQLTIWNNKANGLRPVLDEFGDALDINLLNDDEKVFAILRWSALPGASRHHWGTDIDVFDRSRMPPDYQLQLTLAEAENKGPFAEFHLWLTQELQQNTDFFRPYIPGVGNVSPEPWHLSYAPLANIFAAQLNENILRQKIEASDIALKASVLENLSYIFNNYIKPYQ